MKIVVKLNVNNYESSGVVCLVDKILSCKYLVFLVGFLSVMIYFFRFLVF